MLFGSSYVVICITLLCRCCCYGNLSCCYGVVGIQIAMDTMRCFLGMGGSSGEILFICRCCCVTDMVAMVTRVWWRLPLVAAAHVTRGGSPSPLLPAQLKKNTSQGQILSPCVYVYVYPKVSASGSWPSTEGRQLNLKAIHKAIASL